MEITFRKLVTTDKEIASTMERWSNDPAITHLIRPNQNQNDLNGFIPVTVETLERLLEEFSIHLIYMDGLLVGEMNFQADPIHLYKKETGTAWIGLVIGEESARGLGIGFLAMKYLEEKIREQKFNRIELGVFEFNIRGIKLYKKLGFQEIGRIADFTYWRGKMWQDIRMEKLIN